MLHSTEPDKADHALPAQKLLMDVLEKDRLKIYGTGLTINRIDSGLQLARHNGS
jgi:hypothetical protein